MNCSATSNFPISILEKFCRRINTFFIQNKNVTTTMWLCTEVPVHEGILDAWMQSSTHIHSLDTTLRWMVSFTLITCCWYPLDWAPVSFRMQWWYCTMNVTLGSTLLTEQRKLTAETRLWQLNYYLGLTCIPRVLPLTPSMSHMT